jgi:hypothetical protein
MRIQRLTQANSGLDHKEWQIVKRLNTPAKIQNFLNTLKFDHRDGDKIDRSVRGILKARKADCAGGAVLSAAAMWVNRSKPLLLDLNAPHPDVDHVVALVKVGKFWGAVSKTNHAVLNFREPVYRDVRELVMSYFHEYFLPSGRKTLRSYSKPFDLARFGTKWLTDGDRVMDIIHKLDTSKHTNILTQEQIKNLRKADKVEIKAANIVVE